MSDLIFEIKIQDVGKRLDQFLEKETTYSRSQIKRYLEKGNITVDGKRVKAGFSLSLGTVVIFQEPEEYKISPKNLKIAIIYEDNDIVVVNKPKGLVVHPGAAREQESLVHSMLAQVGDLPMGDDPLRPGIVHRLDKNTSGFMVVAKTYDAMVELVDLFKKRKVVKKYYAFVEGKISSSGSVSKPIGRSLKDRKKMAIRDDGKEAYTEYTVLKSFANESLLSIEIKTGRTHQIRVHLASIGHPVLGDPIYGNHNSYGVDSQLLESYYLSFSHPISKETLIFEKALPQSFINFSKKLKL